MADKTASGTPGHVFGMSVSVKNSPSTAKVVTNCPPFDQIKSLLSGRPLKGPQRLARTGR